MPIWRDTRWRGRGAVVRQFATAQEGLPAFELAPYPSRCTLCAMKIRYGRNLPAIAPSHSRPAEAPAAKLRPHHPGALERRAYGRKAHRRPRGSSRRCARTLGLETVRSGIGLAAMICRTGAGTADTLTRAAQGRSAPTIARAGATSDAVDERFGLKLPWIPMARMRASCATSLTAAPIHHPRTSHPVETSPPAIRTEIETWRAIPCKLCRHVLKCGAQFIGCADRPLERATPGIARLNSTKQRFPRGTTGRCGGRMMRSADAGVRRNGHSQAACRLWRPLFSEAARWVRRFRNAIAADGIARRLLEIRGTRVFAAHGGVISLERSSTIAIAFNDGNAASWL